MQIKNSYDFEIRMASSEHLAAIMEIMKKAQKNMKDKTWFAPSTREELLEVINRKGFILGAWEKESGELAGFFVTIFPDREENMGQYIGLSEKEMHSVVHMDTVVVSEKYRGNHLHEKMLRTAEEILKKEMRRSETSKLYLLCTVHPDNIYSLRNMQQNGYRILLKRTMYQNLERYLLCKIQP